MRLINGIIVLQDTCDYIMRQPTPLNCMYIVATYMYLLVCKLFIMIMISHCFKIHIPIIRLIH